MIVAGPNVEELAKKLKARFNITMVAKNYFEMIKYPFILKNKKTLWKVLSIKYCKLQKVNKSYNIRLKFYWIKIFSVILLYGKKSNISTVNQNVYNLDKNRLYFSHLNNHLKSIWLWMFQINKQNNSKAIIAHFTIMCR